MQQYAPTFHLARGKTRRPIWLGGVVFGLLAITAVVLVLALEGGSQTVERPAVVERGSGGAAATARPDESRTAAAVGAGRQSSPVTVRPDESKVATAISLRRQPLTVPVRPDESAVASAITRGESNSPLPPASIPDLRTGP